MSWLPTFVRSLGAGEASLFALYCQLDENFVKKITNVISAQQDLTLFVPSDQALTDLQKLYIDVSIGECLRHVYDNHIVYKDVKLWWSKTIETSSGKKYKYNKDLNTLDGDGYVLRKGMFAGCITVYVINGVLQNGI